MKEKWKLLIANTVFILVVVFLVSGVCFYELREVGLDKTEEFLSIRTTVLYLLVVLIMLSMVASYYISSRITKPLGHLNDVIGGLKGGTGDLTKKSILPIKVKWVQSVTM